MKSIHSLLFTAFFIFSQFSLSFSQQNETELENTQISILTCRSGDQLYSTFGHTAIRIFNPVSNVDYVYNYGLFNFNTPNFYPKFMRGQLPYFLGATKMDSFLRDYNYERRSVFEQVLILTNSQKKEILEFLINNAKPENRKYRYDFFYDNCATRVVDVFSMPGNIEFTSKVEKKTFRDLLKENLQNLVWSEFGIDLVIGARADILADRRGQMFLPEYVMSNLASARKNGSDLLAKPAQLAIDFEDLNASRKTKGFNWPLLCTSLLLFITLLINTLYTRWARIYNKSLLIICAILGLFLLFMWFGTNHGATRDNWNVLWLNPLIFLYLLTKGKLKMIMGYGLIFVLGVSALNCCFTFLPQFFNFAFLPLIISLLIVLYKELEKTKSVELHA